MQVLVARGWLSAAAAIALLGACDGGNDEVRGGPESSAGSGGSEPIGGAWPAGGTAGATPTYTPGTVLSSSTALPDGEPTCCEHEWTIRALHYHPGATTPRRMYFSACDTAGATPTMWVSLAVGVNAQHPEEDPSSGALIETRLDSGTGTLVPTGVARRFPECVWMEGVATSDDCSTIGVLCRRKYGDADFDFDSLATHADKDWMTQPDCADQEMWLYEWTNGDITTEPGKYVVHRAVGTGWEYGNNTLHLGDDNTYGIGVKARVFGGDTCHEADAFLVMDRADHHLTSRGWSWACGTGHTLFNHPTYNPATQKYAVLCGTDASNHGSPLGGLWMRVEDGTANEFHTVNYEGLRIKGGVGALRPLADGGYLGAIIGIDGGVTAQDTIPLEPPTSIGLARFDAAGSLVGQIHRVAAAETKYLSYPQLAPLGNGRYLLGYGEMYDLARPDDMNDDAYRVPLAYFVLEIDESGTPLTEPQLLDGVGWGEQDQMVALGDGRVGWAHIPNPTLENLVVPSCNSPTLQLSTYSVAD